MSEEKTKIKKHKSIPHKNVCQSIRIDLFDKLHEALVDRPGVSRNTWVQEAIIEKLKKAKKCSKKLKSYPLQKPNT